MGEGIRSPPRASVYLGYVLSLGSYQHILRTGRAQSITYKHQDLHWLSTFSCLTSDSS